jgi:hypothetical protein
MLADFRSVMHIQSGSETWSQIASLSRQTGERHRHRARTVTTRSRRVEISRPPDQLDQFMTPVLSADGTIQS